MEIEFRARGPGISGRSGHDGKRTPGGVESVGLGKGVWGFRGLGLGPLGSPGLRIEGF